MTVKFNIFYIQLAVAVIIGVALMLGINYIRNLQKQADVGTQRGAVIETTTGVLADGKKDDEGRAKVEAGVTTGREEFKANIEEAKRNEPETVARAERAVPASVRGAYRARRFARERSAGIEGERGEEPATTPASQR